MRGGLADPDSGLTTVLVAASGTGKTTASRHLGQFLGYVSDETVSVDPHDLSITPYPKPLSVIVDPEAPKEQLSPDQLHLRHAPSALRMNHLMLLERNPDLASCSISDPLPLAEALTHLVSNISALPSLDRPLSTLLSVIGRCGGVRRVSYADIDDVAPELVSMSSIPTSPWQDVSLTRWSNPNPVPVVSKDVMSSPPPLLTTFPRAEADTARVATGPWIEAVENPENPGELLVLLTHRFTILGGIGPVVFHTCRKRGQVRLSELVEAVVEAHGPNPMARDLVLECLEQMTETGALVASTDRGFAVE